MGRPKDTRPQEEFIFSFTHKLWIKNVNESCHFVENSELKRIYYDAFFKHKYHSAVLTSSIGSINVTKTKYKASNPSSTSVKYIYDEVSGQITAVNEPQENESNYDAVSIYRAYLSFKKDTNLIEKDGENSMEDHLRGY